MNTYHLSFRQLKMYMYGEGSQGQKYKRETYLKENTVKSLSKEKEQ